MDRVIRRYTAIHDGDLALCPERGVAYQRHMGKRVPYDAAYFEKCKAKAGSEIANKLNIGRVGIVDKYLAGQPVLDVGIGVGEFIQARGGTITKGYDINPKAVEWLKKNSLWSDSFDGFSGYTFWDVIEHVEDPANYLGAVPKGAWLFASIPVFSDLREIRRSKHYRPGEHLYYWTAEGFIAWMREYRFALVETSLSETEAGRDSIQSFAFLKSLPDYHDTVAQYQQLHGRYYGASSNLYLELVAREVQRLGPKSILDFGCGRSDLVAHFWRDGARRIARYDPAISEYKTMPEGMFDMVLCNDVMEHIPMVDVDHILQEIRSKSKRVLFTISMRPARAKLPDGRNAHITLLSAEEWTAWVQEVFGRPTRIETPWDHILMLATF